MPNNSGYCESVRIAFLILNHRPPEQLIRLLSTLQTGHPGGPIVVHNDKFRVNLDAEAMETISNIHVLTSDKPICWGDFSIVDACWRSITWLVEHRDFDWVVLLSGQDYPIKPLDTLADYLGGSKADALLRATPIKSLSGSAVRRDRRRRYLYQYRPAAISLREEQLSDRLRYGLRRSTGSFIDVINIMQPFLKVYRFPDKMAYRVGWRARSTPFTQNYPCWYGSMWFGLSRHAAEFIAACAHDRPDYVEYYRRTIIPDESATATLICNAPELYVESRDLHYTRWTRPNTGHPDVFTVEDLPELRAAPAYFARKFDIYQNTCILDRLDEIVLGNSPGLTLGKPYC